MNLVYKQEVLNTLCDNCDTVQAVCPHYPCKRYIGIERLPSVDAVEVVRCKDCKHYDSFNNGRNGMCGIHIDAFKVFYPNDYCSYGERKDG